MAHFQKHQHSSAPHTDEDGNPIHRTETTGDSEKRWFDTTMAADLQGHGGGQHNQGHRGAQLSGSSSSNSSSSEEIGSGGIRKKGMKDKIKMKLPGGIITTPGGYNVRREGRQQHHEKEGMVEMIKEKFPEQSQ